MGDVPCGVLLRLENQFGADNVCPWRGLLKSPSSGFLQRCKFLLDGFLPEGPIRPALCLSERPWFDHLRIGNLSSEEVLKAMEVLEQRRGAVDGGPPSP